MIRHCNKSCQSPMSANKQIDNPSINNLRVSKTPTIKVKKK